MKVKLIQMTQNPIDIMWTAARTCYSEKSPIEMWDNRYKDSYGEPDMDLSNQVFNEKQEKMWKLVKQVLDSSHLSIAEHIYFTFAIEGVSRSLMAQLTRHRTGIVFCIQSQRYVEIKEDYNTIKELVKNCTDEDEEIALKANIELQEITEKYFINNTNANSYTYGKCLESYLARIAQGQKPEDARMVLPNATKTNITMSINLRELMHVCNLRLCSRAQSEIRNLFNIIKQQVTEKDKRLGDLLVPNCERIGYCPEKHGNCGRKPNLSTLLASIKLISNASHETDMDLSHEDFKLLKERMENPQKNEKLKKLLKRKSK